MDYSEIQGFQSLRTIGEKLEIQFNACTAISDFPELESIKGRYGGLNIQQNEIIKLVGFNKLVYSSGIGVSHNENLTEINGFNNLLEIVEWGEAGEDVRGFSVYSTQALTKIVGFEKLERGDISISGGLTEISTFPNLREGTVFLSETFLTDIAGFNAFNGGYISLTNNSKLENISGFNAVKGTYQRLGYNNTLRSIDLSSNVLLKDITGFAALDSLGGLWITGCYSLETLPLVDRLQYLSTLRIENNYSLTTIPVFQPTVLLNGLIVTGNTVLEDYTNFQAVIDENTDVTISNNKYNPTKEDILSGAVKPEE